MHRRTVLRWLLIAFCLAVYWWGVANAIANGRDRPDSKHTEWLDAVVLTLPWSFPGFKAKPEGADERAWRTAATVGGALLNSLIFAQIIRWLTRSPRQTPGPPTTTTRPPADGLPRPTIPF